MKNVALTGHTRGLGKALAETISADEVSVRGFSRGNGYDISLKSDRDRIINESEDCQVFINNAFNWLDNSQTDLLVELFYRWESLREKTIVCIGSRVSDWPHRPDVDLRYALYKSNLEAAVRDLQRRPGARVRLMVFRPGRIDTPLVSGRPDPKMNPEEVSAFIWQTVRQSLESRTSFRIDSVTFSPSEAFDFDQR